LSSVGSVRIGLEPWEKLLAVVGSHLVSLLRGHLEVTRRSVRIVEFHHRVDDHPVPCKDPRLTADLIEVPLNLVRLARSDRGQVLEGGPFDRLLAPEVRQNADQNQGRHRQREHCQKQLRPNADVLQHDSPISAPPSNPVGQDRQQQTEGNVAQNTLADEHDLAHPVSGSDAA